MIVIIKVTEQCILLRKIDHTFINKSVLNSTIREWALSLPASLSEIYVNNAWMFLQRLLTTFLTAVYTHQEANPWHCNLYIKCPVWRLLGYPIYWSPMETHVEETWIRCHADFIHFIEMCDYWLYLHGE